MYVPPLWAICLKAGLAALVECEEATSQVINFLFLASKFLGGHFFLLHQRRLVIEFGIPLQKIIPVRPYICIPHLAERLQKESRLDILCIRNLVLFACL